MTQRCNNCGAELFAGQQFCRQCGARTGLLSHDDVATQILPGQQPGPAAPPPTATAPIGGARRTTEPNFGPLPTGPAYQPPQQVTPLGAHAPATIPAARRGNKLMWTLLVVLLVFVGGAVVAGALLIAEHAHTVSVSKIKVTPPKPPIVPHPPGVPGADEDADTLDEDADTSDVSDSQTVITKTFALTPEEGAFEVKNLNGDITVEGWDEAQAEVKVIKRGGTPDDRENMEIKVERDGNRLGLHTDGGGGQVTYEIKLPQRLQHVALSTLNGNVKIDGVHSGLEVATQNGNIKLADVGGEISTKTLHGNTKVVLSADGHDAQQVFNSLNGNIEVELQDDINAIVKLEATTGSIDVSDSLGLNVVKEMVGQRAAGQLGTGGPPLVIKTLSGNIKLKK
jgi:Putative adhesin